MRPSLGSEASASLPALITVLDRGGGGRRSSHDPSIGSCRQRTPRRHTHGNWLDTEITHLIIWKTPCLGLSRSDPAKATGSSRLFKRLRSLLARRCIKFPPAVLAVPIYFTRKRGKNSLSRGCLPYPGEERVFLTRCLVDTEAPRVRGTSRFLFRDPTPRASSISSTSLHLPWGWGPTLLFYGKSCFPQYSSLPCFQTPKSQTCKTGHFHTECLCEDEFGALIETWGRQEGLGPQGWRPQQLPGSLDPRLPPPLPSCFFLPL